MNLTKTLSALVLGVGLTAVAAAEETRHRESQSLYNLKCALCHGNDGAPSALFAKKGVKSLKDTEWQAARSDAEIRKVITEGAAETLMRGFKEEMSGPEIDEMIAFVRKLGPPKP